MSYFAIVSHDAPDSVGPRADARDAHFAHIETILDKIAVAGPLKDADGNNIGSLVVLKCDSAADAEAILKSDPYFKAGVWERWDIYPFLPAAGDWIGGKIW
jgi:uncharacterized protein